MALGRKPRAKSKAAVSSITAGRGSVMSLSRMSARHFLGGAAVGAGLVYFLDPDRGGQRRERVRSALARRPGRYGSRLGDIHGLQAANLSGRGGLDLSRIAQLAGSLLTAYGALRRGTTGSLIKTLGAGLAATATRRAVALPLGGERRRTIDIQKTLYVEAPLDRVYAFGSSCENLPLFVTHVREVTDLGGGRWRWVVDGPTGEAISWVVSLTEQVPNRLIAWRSEPGAVLDNAGVIRFGSEGPGTRIDFRFCYSPPAGSAGRATAEFFGGDPRTRLNADLGRLKSLLESTIRSDTHG
jgi:uncharacterized membrane protein